MTSVARHGARFLGVLALAAATALAAGCAKDPTTLAVTIDADPTAPPILILRTTIARTSDPTVQSSSKRSSPYGSDAADRPGPFIFPVNMLLTVDSSFAGDVTVTVEGIDWDTSAVTASGSAPASVVAEKMASASLTLAPIRGGGPSP